MLSYSSSFATDTETSHNMLAAFRIRSVLETIKNLNKKRIHGNTISDKFFLEDHVVKSQSEKVKKALFIVSLMAIGASYSSPSFADHFEENDTTLTETSVTVMGAQQAFHTTQAVNSVFDRLTSLDSVTDFGKTGIASGEIANNISVWLNPFYAHVRDTNVSTGYNGNTYGAFFGGDYKVNPATTAGLMLGVDNTHINSKVNGGGSDTTGVTVAPYARYKFSKNYSADATFGYTTSDSDNERFAIGSRISGTSDTSRWFGSVGVNGSFWQDRWNFVPRIGTTIASDHRDASIESDGTAVAKQDTSFGQAQMGVKTSYYFKKVAPWISATYAYDYERKLPTVASTQVKPKDDRDQLILGIGATVFGYGAITGDLSVKQTVFKEKYDNTSVGFTVSAAF